MSNYRWADLKSQWFQDDYPGADLHLNADTMVAVVHTTETAGWPSYNGGTTAPNYTGLPPIGSRMGQWRGHFPDEKSSRALQNDAGGVETNTLNAVQLELIGTCDPAHEHRWGNLVAGRDYVYWPDATPAQLNWLGAILADFHERHGLKLVAPAVFKAYPGSYGEHNGVRLSFAEWRNAAGVYGHQHIPENDHGDPGSLAIGIALNHAKSLVYKPVVQTRIEKFRQGPPYDLALLDAAVRDGRTGLVKDVRDEIVKQVRRLPNEHGTRIATFKDEFEKDRVLRTGLLYLAVKGGRLGTVRSVFTNIRTQIARLPKR